MGELHLFIVWNSARSKENAILDDIKLRFCILRCYVINWSTDLVSSNFTRFYGQRLPVGSAKEEECGVGAFLLIIVRDENPTYALRDTLKGPQVVNINIFDSKIRYREWTGGGHKVHATNNTRETEHDLMLLLEATPEDFNLTNSIPWDGNFIFLSRDIAGAHGWNSIGQLFRTLNHTVDYVIIRGKEHLTLSCASKEHEDIDILVNGAEDARFIINGTSVFSTSRPHEKICISEKNYIIDLWDTSLLYYDKCWQQDMLTNKVLFNDAWVLHPKDYYYALLYHCLIIKGFVSSDYRSELLSDRADKDLEQELALFLQANNYFITMPLDASSNLNLSGCLKDYAFNNGVIIKSSEVTVGNHSYHSDVRRLANSYIKSGSKQLIDNEYTYLTLLSKFGIAPDVLNYDKADNTLEISALPGVNPKVFFSNNENLKYATIRDFILACIDNLSILTNLDVIHRDLTPENILVSHNKQGRCTVSFIDFAWAIQRECILVAERPEWLGHTYIQKGDTSDLYSLGSIIMELLPHSPYIVRTSSLLQSVHADSYLNKKKVLSILRKARKSLSPNFILDGGYYFQVWIKKQYDTAVISVPFIRRVRRYIHNRLSLFI